MGWIERIRSLWPGGSDETNIENKTIVIIPGVNDYPVQQHHPGELVLDPTATDSTEEYETLKEIVRELREETEITRQRSLQDKKIVEEGVSDTGIQETVEFFRPLLSDRYLQMLKGALYLRQEWEDDDLYMPRNELRRRREDLIRRFGEEARVISNLCSSGYFDEGRYFRNVYDTLETEYDTPEDTFRDLFEEIVENEPFTVFVSSVQDTSEVVEAVEDKLSRYKRYGVDFVEVRGIGHPNRQTITQVLERLEDEYVDIEYDVLQEEREQIVRIYPESIPDLNE